MTLLLALVTLLSLSPTNTPQNVGVFYALSSTGDQIRVVRYESGDVEAFKKTQDIRVTVAGIGPLNADSIRYAAMSPGNRWLALLIETLDYREWIIIVDMVNVSVAHRLPEKGRSYASVLGWKNRDVLYVMRRSKQTAKNAYLYDVFSLSGPDWTTSEKRVPIAPVEDLPLYVEARKRFERAHATAVTSAVARMKARDYDPVFRPSPGGYPAMEWEIFLRNDNEATVSLDGKMIVALVSIKTGVLSRDPWEREKLILLRAKNRWREERLPQPEYLWALRFWKGYLVIGDGALEPRPGTGRNTPRVYQFARKRITLFNLQTFITDYQLDGDYFLPAPE